MEKLLIWDAEDSQAEGEKEGIAVLVVDLLAEVGVDPAVQLDDQLL